MVTFDIEPVGEVVRLTVTQLNAPIDEKYLEGGRQGWPVILSGLKSLLETGKPRPNRRGRDESRGGAGRSAAWTMRRSAR